MYQFFVKNEQIDIENKKVYITGPDVNHIVNVLRMKKGEEFAVSNGEDGKEYRCALWDFSENEVICELRFVKEADIELPARIHLYQGLPKSDKMELIIQKMTELGVFDITPVSMDRCVMKLDEKKEKSRIARWQGISEAAAKQSKRKIIPEIKNCLSFKEAIKEAASMDVRLVPYEMADGMERTRELIRGIAPGCDVAVFIGPEGGFAQKEIDLALSSGFETITLGKRILRTETAGLTAMAFIMYELEAKF